MGFETKDWWNLQGMNLRKEEKRNKDWTLGLSDIKRLGKEEKPLWETKKEVPGRWEEN